jgi:hypothetical protein
MTERDAGRPAPFEGMPPPTRPYQPLPQEEGREAAEEACYEDYEDRCDPQRQRVIRAKGILMVIVLAAADVASAQEGPRSNGEVHYGCCSRPLRAGRRAGCCVCVCAAGASGGQRTVLRRRT